jgi:hypothetical protein
MHIEDSHWEDYEERFRALAQRVPMHKGARTELASAPLMLCLYGENGMNPEKELELLSQMEQAVDQVEVVEMTTAYWEDLVLYLKK